MNIDDEDEEDEDEEDDEIQRRHWDHQRSLGVSPVFITRFACGRCAGE
jgi:hypothetical protein